MSAVSRRDALRRLTVAGLGTAAALLWSDRLEALAQAHATHGPLQTAAAAGADWTPKVLDAHQNDLVVTLSELIIPQTDTPGAKAALVNRFIDAVLEDGEAADRKSFLKGLAWVDRRSEELFGSGFLEAAPEQQAALLTILSSGHNKTLEDQVGVELFQAVKGMTVTGYYTSEVAMREELKDDGNRFFTPPPACSHPDHGGTAPAPLRSPVRR